MNVVPHPPESAIPIMEVESVDLDSGSRAIVEIAPERSSDQLRLGTVAVSNFSDAAYELRSDGSRLYGPAPIPPSTVADPVVTWVPAIPVRTSLQVVLDDLRGSGGSRTYHVQPIGYEETET